MIKMARNLRIPDVVFLNKILASEVLYTNKTAEK